MRGAERFTRSASFRLARHLPNSWLGEIGHVARFAQGKGWGAATVNEEIKALTKLLQSRDIQQHDIVLDVGANRGDWTAALLQAIPHSSVFCFEPSAVGYAQLTTRFSQNDRVSLIQTAIAKECGVASLFADSPGSTLGSLSHRAVEHLGISFAHRETVSVTTLDTWCRSASVSPTVVKLDIEGHELGALEGGTSILQSVLVVQFEFGPSNIETRTYFRDFYTFFRDVGFRVFRLSPRGLVPVEGYTEDDEAFVVTNYFARRLRE